MIFPIGLEFAERYLKLVIAKPQITSSKLFHYVEPISSFSDEQITGKIKDILKKNKLKPKGLILCLSRNLVTVRNLHLPSKDKQEISQMIDLNIARIVPYKKEEIVFGYCILGADETGYTKVILAIVKGDAIRRQSKIIENTVLLIDKVSLSSYGIWQWILNNHSSEINQTDLYLILDIDFEFTDFIVFSHENLLFTRSINVGANAILDIGELGVTKLLGEVKQSLIMFYNEEINKKPAAVFLSGAHIKSGLSKTIETELGFPVKLVKGPYPTETSGSKDGNIPNDVSLTAISGLSSKDSGRILYFALPEIQIRKSLREKTRELMIAGSSFIYLFTIICVILFSNISHQESYLNKLNQRNAIIEKEMGNLSGQLNKIDFVKSYLSNRRKPLIVFTQLEKMTPDNISISSVAIDEQDKVSIKGQAMQLSDVFKFISTLEQVKYFKNVETKSTRKKKVKDKDVTDFELAFQLTL